MKSKKGVALTIVFVLIMGIVMTLGGLALFFGIVGFLGDTIQDSLCGLNIRLEGSIPKKILTRPLIACKQYQEPIEIDARDLKDCPGIASVCRNPDTDELQEACDAQCARIQIDILTDRCWDLAGRGKKDISGLAAKFLDAASGLTEINTLIAVSKVAYNENLAIIEEAVEFGVYVETEGQIDPEIPIAETFETELSEQDIEALKRVDNMGLLRCYRFTITRPLRSEVNRLNDFTFQDKTFGQSWIYGLGGEGVEAISIYNKKIKVEDRDFTDYEIDKNLWYLLNYEYNQRQDICYISYLDGAKAVSRSCVTWVDNSEGYRFLN